MTVMNGMYKTSPVIERRPETILSRHDVPYLSALTFNAGIVCHEGRYIMLFRNDYGSYEEQRLDGTNIGLAYSEDGIRWKVEPEPVFDGRNFDSYTEPGEVLRAYDPRITPLDGRFYVSFAIDTRHGVCGAFTVTDDFKNYEILSVSVPDNRNMVLFPEKINGRFVRLERPMPVYSRGRDRFDIWLSESPDLVFWGKSRLVLGVEDVPFANDKIGPGAPPLKTEHGWLTVFHAVDIDPARGKNGWEKEWKKRYTIGVMLLDPEDPAKIIGLYKKPLMVPEGYRELEEGMRTNALFPCAALLVDGKVRIYYSAGDAVICLATADLNDLVGLCINSGK